MMIMMAMRIRGVFSKECLFGYVSSLWTDDCSNFQPIRNVQYKYTENETNWKKYFWNYLKCAG